jgi:hypothetical protein
MTTTFDDITDDIHEALSPHRWMTPTEVMSRCPGRSHRVVRDELRKMAGTEDIEGRIGGGPDHPVREYRAWR